MDTYEKKYKEALEVIKDNLDALNEITETGANVVNIQSIKNCFYRAFPEIKEPEDDGIRKEIISALKYANHKGVYDKHIAWLEKKGEKPQGKSALDEIKEEEVEPKFHEGDWITDGYLHNKITDVLEDRYIVDAKFAKRSSIPFKFENYYHLWTIQDAKDGDILASNYNKPFIYNGNHNSIHVGAYCGITTNDKLIIASEEYHWTEHLNIHPATKEQRDKLLKAMADAGYEWDAEKKELKKVEQNPAWNEEDEKNLSGVIDELEANKSEAPEYDYKTYDRFINWLESIKERINNKTK